MSDSAGVSAYRLARAYAVRPLGLAVCATGVAVIALAVARASDGPGWLQTVLLVVAALLALLGLLAAVVVLRPPTIVRLDEQGFWVRRLGDAEVGSWRDVEDVAGEVRAGQRVAYIRRRDGDATLLPLALLEAPAEDVEREVRRRLDSAHGYRRIMPRRDR